MTSTIKISGPALKTTASPTLREARSALTRRHIVDAAQSLFLKDGYAGTSIGAIARRAGVSVQTIYNSVGNKAALLSAMLDAAASGPETPSPPSQFMAERARDADDVAGVIDVLADWFVEVNARTSDVWTVIHQAAAVDGDAAEVDRQRSEQRLRNYGLAAAELGSRGALNGMSEDEAAATIWAIGHPSTYSTLVQGVGWSIVAYRRWLGVALRGALGVPR